MSQPSVISSDALAWASEFAEMQNLPVPPFPQLPISDSLFRLSTAAQKHQ